MTTSVYGIPNCDSVKKARKLLDGRGVAYVFHDYRKQGVPDALLRRWVQAKGWEALLNRKGTTWRTLDNPTKASVTDAETAIAVMRTHPSTIKRPVVVSGATLVVGFDPDALDSL
ncbi:MAG: ArsC family reductase [Burkholderiales bacterium]|nr:ArsC family reductase [Burkholderiales bacterium]